MTYRKGIAHFSTQLGSPSFHIRPSKCVVVVVVLVVGEARRIFQKLRPQVLPLPLPCKPSHLHCL